MGLGTEDCGEVALEECLRLATVHDVDDVAAHECGEQVSARSACGSTNILANYLQQPSIRNPWRQLGPSEILVALIALYEILCRT